MSIFVIDSSHRVFFALPLAIDETDLEEDARSIPVAEPAEGTRSNSAFPAEGAPSFVVDTVSARLSGTTPGGSPLLSLQPIFFVVVVNLRRSPYTGRTQKGAKKHEQTIERATNSVA